MQKVAIIWFVIAWLVCWLIDLTVTVARGPVLIDPILKFVVVLIAVIVVLRHLYIARELW